MQIHESFRLALLVGFLGMGFGAGRWSSQEPPERAEQLPATAVDFSHQFQAIARKVGPAVVSVKAYGKTRRDRLVVRQEGSGVLLRANGLLVTNHHVVMHAERLGIVLADGREIEGRVVGRDPDTDLAPVRIAAEGLTRRARTGRDVRSRPGVLRSAIRTVWD
jgi:S1-C subfamily serine protease